MEENGNIYINLPKAANLTLPDPGLVQYYQDLEERIIWIDSEIDETTRSITQSIIKWNREDKLIPPNQRRPIKLMIASPGGELDVADSLVSVIKLSKTPVYGMAMECVASAASLIFLACHRKFALTNAYFIFHEGSCTGMSGDYDKVKAAMDDYQALVEKMTKYYIDNTGYTEEEVRTNIKKDWYIHIDEALEKGIVDETITDIDVLV